jgi:hypothetical protein
MTVRQRITSVATIGAVVATVGGCAAATPAMARLGGTASGASAAAGGGFSCASLALYQHPSLAAAGW